MLLLTSGLVSRERIEAATRLDRGRLGSLNAYPTGTPTVAPGTAAFAALLARIGRSDRRHGIRYFYCLGGHALAVAGYQPGPLLICR